MDLRARIGPEPVGQHVRRAIKADGDTDEASRVYPAVRVVLDRGREPGGGFCLDHGAGSCAQFFGGQTSSSSYALMWQWSGGGVANGIGGFNGDLGCR